MFGPLGLVERARVAAPVFSVDVASALRNSPVLSECHARVAAAGCDLEPAFASGATLLIPMTLELYQEPLPPTYCGHATSSLHRPTLREVSTGYGDDPESLRPGLLEMIEHIHDDATDVLALIHDSVATKDPPEKRIVKPSKEWKQARVVNKNSTMKTKFSGISFFQFNAQKGSPSQSLVDESVPRCSQVKSAPFRHIICFQFASIITLGIRNQLICQVLGTSCFQKLVAELSTMCTWNVTWTRA